MVTWKKTTFKQRLIRLLDRWSNKLRPKYIPFPEGDHEIRANTVERGVTKAGNPFFVTDISLVTHCPYCGTDDWDTPKTKLDGSVCNHPTKLRVVK